MLYIFSQAHINLILLKPYCLRHCRRSIRRRNGGVREPCSFKRTGSKRDQEKYFETLRRDHQPQADDHKFKRSEGPEFYSGRLFKKKCFKPSKEEKSKGQKRQSRRIRSRFLKRQKTTRQWETEKGYQKEEARLKNRQKQIVTSITNMIRASFGFVAKYNFTASHNAYIHLSLIPA